MAQKASVDQRYYSKTLGQAAFRTCYRLPKCESPIGLSARGPHAEGIGMPAPIGVAARGPHAGWLHVIGAAPHRGTSDHFNCDLESNTNSLAP